MNRLEVKIRSAVNNLNEEAVDKSVMSLIEGHLKRSGLSFKKTEKIGFAKYSLDDNYSVVYDNVGIAIKKGSKEVKYFDKPKLDYKKISDVVEENFEESTEGVIEEGKSIDSSLLKKFQKLFIEIALETDQDYNKTINFLSSEMKRISKKLDD
jgi:hypothetical protein